MSPFIHSGVARCCERLRRPSVELRPPAPSPRRRPAHRTSCRSSGACRSSSDPALSELVRQSVHHLLGPFRPAPPRLDPENRAAIQYRPEALRHPSSEVFPVQPVLHKRDVIGGQHVPMRLPRLGNRFDDAGPPAEVPLVLHSCREHVRVACQDRTAQPGSSIFVRSLPPGDRCDKLSEPAQHGSTALARFRSTLRPRRVNRTSEVGVVYGILQAHSSVSTIHHLPTATAVVRRGDASS